MNIQYEYDLATGNWKSLELTKATRNDQADSKETREDISPRSLNIRDLGYITLVYLKAVIAKKAYFVNRLPKVGVYQLIEGKYQVVDWKLLDNKIKREKHQYYEFEVYLGKQEKIKSRMILSAVADKEVNKRLRKARKAGKRTKGYQLSKEYKIKAKYSIYITNVPSDVLSTIDVVKTYKLRWQIELIFKTWKSNLNVHKTKDVKKERMECQLFAKLIWILINTKLFQIANFLLQKKNPCMGCSPPKFFKRAIKFSGSLMNAFNDKSQFLYWYNKTIGPIIPYLIVEKRLKEDTHYQTLNNIING
jgi:IS4 transposase